MVKGLNFNEDDELKEVLTKRTQNHEEKKEESKSEHKKIEHKEIVSKKKTHNERNAGRKPIVEGGVKPKLIYLDDETKKEISDSVTHIQKNIPRYSDSAYLREAVKFAKKHNLSREIANTFKK